MSNDSNNDILNLLQEQHLTPSANQSLEQFLIEGLLNPAEKTVRRIRLIEDPNSSVISEIREELIINQEGDPEKIEEETINICSLDDGTPMNTYGICRCQACQRLVRAENLSRCICGKTTCIMCGRFDAKTGIWFCSFWHKILGKFFGCFGIGFR
jgi:hypothetical protein